MEDTLRTSNIYGAARAEIMQRFGEHIEGSSAAFFLVLSETPLSNEAKNALEKTAVNLGWEMGPSYVCTSSPQLLSKADVFEIVEGLDPVCVCVLGPQVCEVVSQAYNCDVPKQGRFRLFGRDACSIEHLDAQLESEAGKQRIWGVLKTLPRAK